MQIQIFRDSELVLEMIDDSSDELSRIKQQVSLLKHIVVDQKDNR